MISDTLRPKRRRRYGVVRPLRQVNVTIADEASKETNPETAWLMTKCFQNVTRLMVVVPWSFCVVYDKIICEQYSLLLFIEVK